MKKTSSKSQKERERERERERNPMPRGKTESLVGILLVNSGQVCFILVQVLRSFFAGLFSMDLTKSYHRCQPLQTLLLADIQSPHHLDWNSETAQASAAHCTMFERNDTQRA